MTDPPAKIADGDHALVWRSMSVRRDKACPGGVLGNAECLVLTSAGSEADINGRIHHGH
jgi:hypothetical protein